MKTAADGFIPVHETRIAAALGACGIPIRIHKGLDFRTEGEWATFACALNSVENPAWETRTLLEMEAAGTIPHDHPLADSLRAIDNRARLIEWIKKGGNVFVAKDGEGRWIVKSFDGCRPAERQPEMFRTTDIMLAASLAMVGCEIVSCQPLLDNPSIAKIMVNRFSKFQPDGTRLDALCLVANFRDGLMAQNDPANPFLRAMHACNAYQRLVESVREAIPVLFIQGNHPTRHAYLRADASGTSMDKVRRFFSVN